MCRRFTEKLEEILRESGWYPGRTTSEEFRLLEFVPHRPCQDFLLEFGGLNLGGWIGCEAELVNEEYGWRDRLDCAKIDSLQPVASSWYWCEGTLWIDAEGRTYQADDYELAFVGATADEALELLLLKKPIPPEFPRWKVLPTAK